MSTRQAGGISGCSSYLVGTLLPSVTTLRLQNIYDYEKTDLAGYPAATVTVTEQPAARLDNSRNKHTYRFVIRVFIDRNTQNFGSNTAESILRTLADEITLKVDGDNTLGGNCIFSEPAAAKFGYINAATDNIRVMEITLDCVDAVTFK